MALITEDHLEQQCLEWFKELGYAYAFAPDLALDGTSPEQWAREDLGTRIQAAVADAPPSDGP